MHNQLYNLFSNDALLKSRVSGKLNIITENNEEIIVEVRNTSSKKLAQLLNFLRTIGDLYKVELNVSNIDIEKIRNNNIILTILTDNIRGLANLVSIHARECRKVG